MLRRALLIVSLLASVGLSALWISNVCVSEAIVRRSSDWEDALHQRDHHIYIFAGQGAFYCNVEETVSTYSTLVLARRRLRDESPPTWTCSVGDPFIPKLIDPQVDVLGVQVGRVVSGFQLDTMKAVGTGVEARMPMWMPVAASFAVLLLTLRQHRRKRKTVITCCKRCGYDCRATPGRCPECGCSSIDGEADADSRRPDRLG